MPETKDLRDAQIAFVCTEIGRGHPFYLDGLIATFITEFPLIKYYRSDVFTLSRGMALNSWRAVERLYRIGSRGGIISGGYNRLRKILGSQTRPGLASGILGRDIRKALAGFGGVVVVSHPLLASLLAHSHRLVYQHGELAAPDEAIVGGCVKTLVPTPRTAAIFTACGISPDAVFVSGQCIELELVEPAKMAFEQRLLRLGGTDPLVVGLFSSGAYPRDHLRRLRLAAISLVKAGHNVIYFAGLSRKVAGKFERYLWTDSLSSIGKDALNERATVLCASDRMGFDTQVAEYFPQLDLFLAPAHERTNWAVGLGIPQLILCPHLGSYAPLNASIAVDQGVAAEIVNDDMARNIAEIIAYHRSTGYLSGMAANGFGQYPLDGFSRCAGEVAAIATA